MFLFIIGQYCDLCSLLAMLMATNQGHLTHYMAVKIPRGTKCLEFLIIY